MVDITYRQDTIDKFKIREEDKAFPEFEATRKLFYNDVNDSLLADADICTPKQTLLKMSIYNASHLYTMFLALQHKATLEKICLDAIQRSKDCIGLIPQEYSDISNFKTRIKKLNNIVSFLEDNYKNEDLYQRATKLVEDTNFKCWYCSLLF